MNRSLLHGCRLAVVLLLVFTVVATARPWKDKSGKQIAEAEFASRDGDKVTLRQRDGKRLTVSLNKLSDADRAEVERKSARAEGKSQTAPTAELLSVRVAKPLDPTIKFEPFANYTPGTEFMFLVTAGEKRFIRFDDEESEITVCRDDRGNQLTAQSENEAPFGYFNSFHTPMSTGGKHLLVVAELPRVPAQNATKVTLQGMLSVRCAGGVTSEIMRDVPIVDGGEISAGPIRLTMRIVKPEESNAIVQVIGDEIADAFGDMSNDKKYPFKIGLSSDEPLHELKKLEFLDAEGKTLKSQWLTMGLHDMKYGLLEKPDKLTIKVHYFTELETIQIPLKIETSLGL